MEGSGNKRLRVLHLVDSLLPGGAERLAVTLAIRLDPARFQPSVCVSRPMQASSPLVDDVRQAGVPIVELRRRSRYALWSWAPLVRLLRRERIDILHAHMFGSNLWGAALAPVAGVPVFVAHEHGFTFDGTALRPLLDRELIARAADAYIVVSRADERTMIDGGVPPEKLRLVPNAIAPLPAPSRDLRAELGIARDAEVVGAISVLRPEKALEVLVAAAKHLARDFPRLRVLVAGAGPEEERLRALVRARRLEGTVQLLGFRRDVADVLAALDVVVSTSDREGSPLALMEAMAAGKAVVATHVGGAPDLIEDGVHGLLVPPRDPAALADALAGLLRDGKARAELGRNAKERQRQEFDIHVVVARVERLYEELAAAAGGTLTERLG